MQPPAQERVGDVAVFLTEDGRRGGGREGEGEPGSDARSSGTTFNRRSAGRRLPPRPSESDDHDTGLSQKIEKRKKKK